MYTAKGSPERAASGAWKARRYQTVWRVSGSSVRMREGNGTNRQGASAGGSPCGWPCRNCASAKGIVPSVANPPVARASKRRLKPEHAQLVGFIDRFATGVYGQLAVDVFHMGGDGVGGDEEQTANILEAEALGDELEDLSLARGECPLLRR